MNRVRLSVGRPFTFRRSVVTVPSAGRYRSVGRPLTFRRSLLSCRRSLVHSLSRRYGIRNVTTVAQGGAVASEAGGVPGDARASAQGSVLGVLAHDELHQPHRPSRARQQAGDQTDRGGGPDDLPRDVQESAHEAQLGLVRE